MDATDTNTLYIFFLNDSKVSSMRLEEFREQGSLYFFLIAQIKDRKRITGRMLLWRRGEGEVFLNFLEMLNVVDV